MTQRGIVTKIRSDGIEVRVLRTSMCADNCASCKGGCSPAAQTVFATNDTQSALHVGDIVGLETDTKQVLGTSAAVYFVPLVGLFLGYFLAAQWTQSELLCALCALLGCAICFVLLRILDAQVRRKHQLLVRITDIFVQKNEQNSKIH